MRIDKTTPKPGVSDAVGQWPFSRTADSSNPQAAPAANQLEKEMIISEPAPTISPIPRAASHLQMSTPKKQKDHLIKTHDHLITPKKESTRSCVIGQAVDKPAGHSLRDRPMHASRKLRIFYASDSTPNPWCKVQSNIWRNNLCLPLVDLGHDVVEFQYDWGDTFKRVDTQSPRDADFIAGNRPLVSAELLRQIRTAHRGTGSGPPIDLFFSYFYDACVEPAAIDEIRRMGITTVNWFCNGSYQLSLVKEISPHYDWCLVPEMFRLKDYQAMGARPIYCQEAANPAIYKPHDGPREFDVTFVGQAYGDRPLFIRYLLENGVNVQVWGHGWRNPHPRYLPRETFDAITAIPEALRHEPLSDEEMIRMYSRSRINLGFSTCGDTHLNGERILQVRLRDFEVPMSGGFYLVERMPELAEFFALGREVECYTGREELLQKIVHYLAHEQERAAVAQAGRKRALAEHSWQRRFKKAFAVMRLGS